MNEKAALIGYTGFIGSYLQGQIAFSDFFNSSNIENINEQRFERIVCAGASAAKWLANAEPQLDKDNIQRLIGHLQTVRAEHFVLISTIDVFQTPVNVDETSPVVTTGLHPYGRHRYELETFVRQRFPSCCIIRLPAMFGPGLKKNALFDLLNDHNIERLPMDAVFQWYNLKHLPDHIRRSAGLAIAHLATEPIVLRRIVEALFPGINAPKQGSPGLQYDMRTLHNDILGGTGGYVSDAKTIIGEIRAFVAEERDRLKMKT